MVRQPQDKGAACRLHEQDRPHLVSLTHYGEGAEHACHGIEVSDVEPDDLDYAQARRHLGATGARVEYRHLPGPRVWQRAPFEAVVPAEVLQAITGWIAGAQP